MKHLNFESMSVDELWVVHEQIGELLVRKIGAQKEQLEKRLAKLNKEIGLSGKAQARSEGGRVRRPYPKVVPKYRNPTNPSETWSGRGKQPRWLVAQIKNGQSLERFLIGSPRRTKRLAAR